MGRETLELYDDIEVAVEPIKPLPGGGTRVELDEVGGGRWRVDVTSTGEVSDLVTAWNRDDELADVELPDWVDDVLVRLQRA